MITITVKRPAAFGRNEPVVYLGTLKGWVKVFLPGEGSIPDRAIVRFSDEIERTVPASDLERLPPAAFAPALAA